MRTDTPPKIISSGLDVTSGCYFKETRRRPFKGINAKRDDILRWVSLSDCAERFRNFAERFRNRSAKFQNRSAAPNRSKTAPKRSGTDIHSISWTSKYRGGPTNFLDGQETFRMSRIFRAHPKLFSSPKTVLDVQAIFVGILQNFRMSKKNFWAFLAKTKPKKVFWPFFFCLLQNSKSPKFGRFCVCWRLQCDSPAS